MAITKEEMIQEALTNSRNDRKNLERVRSSLFNRIEECGTLSSEDIESVATISEVLTKMNAQIVELTKIAVKDDSSKDDLEKEGIFEEIESSAN